MGISSALASPKALETEESYGRNTSKIKCLKFEEELLAGINSMMLDRQESREDADRDHIWRDAV